MSLSAILGTDEPIGSKWMNEYISNFDEIPGQAPFVFELFPFEIPKQF